jgi:DNA-directed RNA polymerase specialized sigma24 family protein
MGPSNLPGPSPYDSDSSADDVLEYFEYIREAAQRLVSGNIGPVDYEDVAQEVSLKLWLISQRQVIGSPKTYAMKVLRTVKVDMLRKYRPNLYQSLPTDEEDEILEGHLMIMADVEQENPEVIVEQEEAFGELMAIVLGVVCELRPRQQQATVCTLKDRIDNLIPLVDALREKNIETDLEWPAEKTDKQRLYASYAPVRRKLAQAMSISSVG